VSAEHDSKIEINGLGCGEWG